MVSEQTTIKPGLITVHVDGMIKEAKMKSGATWRGLIMRGLKGLKERNIEREREQEAKIAKMSKIIQELSLRCYKLENKNDN